MVEALDGFFGDTDLGVSQILEGAAVGIAAAAFAESVGAGGGVGADPFASVSSVGRVFDILIWPPMLTRRTVEDAGDKAAAAADVG